MAVVANLVVLAVMVLAAEGLNVAGDGDAYLASLQRLAQTEVSTPIEPMAPRPTEPMPVMEPRQPIPPQPIENGAKEPWPQPPVNGDMRQPPMQPPMMQKEIRPEEMRPEREMKGEEPEFEEREEWIDPREIQQVNREMKQMTSELKRFSKQLRTIPGTEGDITKINEILTAISGLQVVLSGSDRSAMREAIQEFREARYWDTLNELRAKVEIPRQIRDWTKSITRLEKILKVKATQTVGVNMALVQERVAEMKQTLSQVQAAYNSGDFDEAQQLMQSFHEEGSNPGEIESAINRIREMKNALRRVRNASARAAVEEVLRTVIAAFDAGDYREANEILNERQNELRQMMFGKPQSIKK